MNAVASPSSGSPTIDTAAGLQWSGADWLDLHFRALQPEYEEALRWVGIQRGWTVLDAGCGCGSYIPLLTNLVGRSGHVHALDLTEENIVRVQREALRDEWDAPVDVRVGSVLALPYADHSQDAVWSANVSQYLSDAELARMLGECMRVTKPGGLVALKEYDCTAALIQPGPVDIEHALMMAGLRSGDVQMRGVARASQLSVWMRAAGLQDIAQHHIPMVRTHPLRGVERRYFEAYFAATHLHARTLGVPPHIEAAWAKLADLDAPDNPFRSPDFLYREMQVVFVGRVT